MMYYNSSGAINMTNVCTASTDTTNFVFGILILAMGILAVFGNGFILLVIGKYPALRSNLCNMLIAILAISDFASGIGLLIRGISEQIFQFTGYCDYTNIVCLALGIVGLFSVQMSQLITAIIAFDRLKAVRDPFQYATQDKLKTSLTAFFVSIVYPLFGTAIAFIGLDYYAHPDICATGSSIPDFYPPYWILFATVVAIVIFYSYARTSSLLKRKLRTVQSSIEKRDLRKQKDVFKAITLVLVVYAICWCLPNLLAAMATAAHADAVIMGNISSVIAVGTGINSSANLFIYAWKHHEIGDHMRKFLNLRVKISNRRGTSTVQPETLAGKRMAFVSTVTKIVDV